MPFTKITSGPDKGKYRSPSGRIYTEKQVRAYYATHGFEREPDKSKAKKKKTTKKAKRETKRRGGRR